MIFNEIYGCYYNAVAKMISLAVEGELNEKKMYEIVAGDAFGESMFTIIPALKNQKWQLIDGNYKTPVVNKPTMPMTALERRWLKTILLDPRVALFQADVKGMDDVEPLFMPEDLIYFDRYSDGDPYDQTSYVENFHVIVQAIREHKKAEIKYQNRKEQERIQVLNPVKIEYSDKDDKFRVLCAGRKDITTINMGRIIRVKKLEESFSTTISLSFGKKETLIFKLTDERKTLERVLMKFAHYKKEVERLGENTYQVKMEYDMDEETDVLIQIMSFGSFVKMIAPAELKEKLRDRIKKQIDLFNFV